MKTRDVLFVLAVAAALGACTKKSEAPRETADSTGVDARPGMIPVPSDSTIAPGTWRWVGTVTPVERIVPPSPDNYTLEFMPDGRVDAKLDCNGGSGGYRIDGKSIRFGPLATTKMMCPPGSMDVKFAQQIDAARIWFMHGDTLMIDLYADSGTMRLVR